MARSTIFAALEPAAMARRENDSSGPGRRRRRRRRRGWYRSRSGSRSS